MTVFLALIVILSIWQIFNLLKMSPKLFSKKKYEQNIYDGKRRALDAQEKVLSDANNSKIKKAEIFVKKLLLVVFVAKCSFSIFTMWCIYNPNHMIVTAVAGLLTLACIVLDFLDLNEVSNVSIHDDVENVCYKKSRVSEIIKWFIRLFRSLVVILLVFLT